MDVNYYTILLVRDSKSQSGDIVRVIAQKEIKLQEENKVSVYGLFLLFFSVGLSPHCGVGFLSLRLQSSCWPGMWSYLKAHRAWTQ